MYFNTVLSAKSKTETQKYSLPNLMELTWSLEIITVERKRNLCLCSFNIFCHDEIKNVVLKVHCALAVKKTNSILGFIKHSITIWSREVIFLLYLTLMWRNLDYCTQFWASQYKNDVKVLECFQRMTTKLVQVLKGMFLWTQIEKAPAASQRVQVEKGVQISSPW